ncbi:hypothetical protein EVJ58_g10140 [Rhodofomes roseus]|uniref:Selenoprotein O n=1 Tax=Rhodofomes roseus TaxID=34475 RepID=A0A4Y9XR26_9APHY|nr:hypothetical protein EVJ58_g10140 [Rhodofomes roseus]
MAKAVDDWRAWLRKYGARIESERGEWGRDGTDVDAERTREMRGANPRFVLRQWVLEEVIKHVERDVDSGKRLLAKVLQVGSNGSIIAKRADAAAAQMACNPFEPWGGEDHEGDEATLDPELKEERRFCSLGDMNYLGYQCSCSS